MSSNTTNAANTNTANTVRSNKPSNEIFIGKKPLMTYVTATLVQLANEPTVVIKARGKSITSVFPAPLATGTHIVCRSPPAQHWVWSRRN